MLSPSRSTRPHSTLAEAYGRAASGWQSTIDRLGYPGAYDSAFAAHPPAHAPRVIDLGTGSGAFAAAYLRAGAPGLLQLDLLDMSAEMLEDARTRLRHAAPVVDTICGGVGDGDLARRYDTALAAHVFEHLHDPVAALSWTRAHLRPGGRLYLVASRPHWCTALLRWKWGHKAWRVGQMEAMLAAAGFVDIRAHRFPAGPPSRTSAAYMAQAPTP